MMRTSGEGDHMLGALNRTDAKRYIMQSGMGLFFVSLPSQTQTQPKSSHPIRSRPDWIPSCHPISFAPCERPTDPPNPFREVQCPSFNWE